MEKQLMQVLEFQTAFGVKVGKEPKMPTKKRRILTQKMLEEEVKELSSSKNILSASDAICDILYVTFGIAQEYGVADRLTMMFDEVHSSNMSKMGEDGKPIYREDGKVMKSDRYREPKLQAILERNWNVYKESEALKEISKEVKSSIERKIENKIHKKLNIIDRFLLWLSNKIDKNLKKKVKVNFPQSIFGPVSVEVYGKTYEVES